MDKLEKLNVLIEFEKIKILKPTIYMIEEEYLPIKSPQQSIILLETIKEIYLGKHQCKNLSAFARKIKIDTSTVSRTIDKFSHPKIAMFEAHFNNKNNSVESWHINLQNKTVNILLQKLNLKKEIEKILENE